jgi:hypothetical protein
VAETSKGKLLYPLHSRALLLIHTWSCLYAGGLGRNLRQHKNGADDLVACN